LGFYQASKRGLYVDKAPRSEIGRRSRRSLGFGCFFFDADLDGLLDLLVVNGHIDETVTTVRRDVQYAQPPHLFLNCGPDGFRDVAEEAGGGFANPKVGRGAAFADFDRDGDLDVLITTNHGPAYLYRNDQFSGNHSIRFRLIGTKSNRDAIGAVVKIYYGGESGSRIVKSGSSYLSQSELALTFGLGKHNRVDRAVITWPNGRVEEHKNLAAGRLYECVEGKLIRDTGGF
ncbi:MAG TPA: CRTAC1 family protein, partial [Bryobacteraceae bacterium]|nr:CRTAC1 family protein [Bryobacteraceae bacterium]